LVVCLACIDHPTTRRDATREEVEHDRQISEALVGANVGDVGHPGLVRRLHVEPAVERVVDGERRLASIRAGTALVADLRPDPGLPRQPSDPARTAALAHVHEVVVKLAITIDLPAVPPSSANELGLPLVFLRALAERILQPGVEAAGLN
jgi:hypothetical protein